jgi:type II restriction/modification system DNA methylase subunit YeeA
VPEVHVITLDDLLDPAKRRLLKWAFTDPERLRPGRTTAHLTEQAAARFGTLAQTLRARGHDPAQVAHFSQQILFCLFAEDIDLLPNKLFAKLLEAGHRQPDRLPEMLETLFGAMATGGLMGVEVIDWFNGGLFSSREILPLERDDIQLLRELAALDWSAIDPTIFGTLFERGLDPDKRSQLGAHYTDPASILRLVEPVVLEPLRAEWAEVRSRIAATLEKAQAAKSPSARTKQVQAAQTLLQGFLDRLARFRVLDPACGSGNFLLLSLLRLKDLEHQVILEAETLGLPRAFPHVGPENVLGIELNPYAAELARVTVWIGEIQWMIGHGFSLSKNPILKPLETIVQRDAILDPDGNEPEWPEADVIVGNPPFLGGSKKRSALGDAYFEALDRLYIGRIPAGADLVTYWFEKARAYIGVGQTKAAGLVSTNSIRGGSNRKVLERICETGRIFEAWSDEPWVNEGAAVRVSLVAFGQEEDCSGARLDGQPVAVIHADLTGQTLESDATVDLTQAKRLADNLNTWSYGSQEKGDFSVSPDLARQLLVQPNPHGKSNASVLKRAVNAKQLTQRREDAWVIDFGLNMALEEASLFEGPFQIVETQVAPQRLAGRDKGQAKRWWLHARPSPKYRNALAALPRVIATPTVSKHRLFTFLGNEALADHQLIVIARTDDATFGILHSRFHELWSLRLCTWLGKGNDPRYTPTTTFETFPLPAGLTPADTNQGIETLDSGAIVPIVAPEIADHARAIAEAAHRLDTLRQNWLNPPEWTERVPEVVPGYPDRIVAKPGHESDLKQRTLTNLYNARPNWLDHAHRAIDAAVAAAYGWDDYNPEMPDSEILSRLLSLNRARAQQSPSVPNRTG